ncbi:hypothetical protein CEUSTIGMA_g3467.t1 [Chlamydomonas eustigma]|uniref:FAD/NAD(P)-binding domain-containing protein n=1 Tax=Chlamydomonas eustigma TaxID=1157962 RepID=A0A250WYV2_9CHLO|nr:hypothetical protein CEUSTIGMA_g3467.t1 [Chlamydomonas eustigma]|eukprot:GAX76024.1 hypothetical protein CEUSTIGMA_g3467.t1 [Chlamydomonas eustigma]
MAISPNNSGPHLLVVGAGFAGCFAAKGAIEAGYRVTTVDKKDFFDIKYAALRAAVQPDSQLAKSYAFKYSDIPGLGSFKQASVARIGKDFAELDTGEVVKFDYLILATGSSNAAGIFAQPQGLTLSSRRSELQETFALVQKAKDIVIVGGGFVGIELAAEIVETFAGKSVHIVHPAARLFDNKSIKISNWVQKWLKDHKVQIHVQERAVKGSEAGTNILKLESGKTIRADLVIYTVGAKPNTEFLNGSEFAELVDKAGRLKVNPDLRVVGYPNVFALGDINDVKEEKLGYLATQQGQLTGKNLALLEKDRNAKLTAWKVNGGVSNGAMLLSLGQNAGTGHFGSCVLFSFMVALAKCKDMFTGKVWNELGVQAGA